MTNLMFSKPTKKVKVKKTLNKVRKTPLAKMKREADKLAGEKCRARGKCQICGSTNVLQWAHIISRRYHCVRWRMDNCLCLCSVCHCRYTNNPDLWIEWIVDHYDKNFKELMDIVHKQPKVNREFMENVIAELNEL